MIEVSIPVRVANSKNRRFVLAEILKHEKHSDHRVIVRCKELHEIAPVTQGRFRLIHYDLA
jgi:hypothetical protein